MPLTGGKGHPYDGAHRRTVLRDRDAHTLRPDDPALPERPTVPSFNFTARPGFVQFLKRGPERGFIGGGLVRLARMTASSISPQFRHRSRRDASPTIPPLPSSAISPTANPPHRLHIRPSLLSCSLRRATAPPTGVARRPSPPPVKPGQFLRVVLTQHNLLAQWMRVEVDMPAPVQPAQCRQKHLPGKSVEDIGKIKKHHARALAEEVQNLIFYVRDSWHRIRGTG